jgi:hypothetical protein
MSTNRAIFTIVTKSYLAYAGVMSKELRTRHPEIPFYVFLADRPDGFFNPDKEPFNVVQIEQILPAELLQTMTGYYTAFELCNALRPFAHLYLSKLAGVKQWFYLDSDIYVTENIESLFNQLNGASILLVPHILRIDIVPQAEKQEIFFLRDGIYNSGCLGIRNSEQALQFLQWWKERLIWLCLHKSPPLECDQSWLNFAPSLFSECKLVRDPGVNVAYWNIHERLLERSVDGDYSVSGHPVPFIHFSCWDWRHPDVPNKYYNIELGASKEAWLQAARDFAEQLRASGIEDCSQWPYSFAKAKNGYTLTPSMRRNYWVFLRGNDKSTVIPSIFDDPGRFEDPKPKPLSLWGATRMWLGAVKQYLFKI